MRALLGVADHNGCMTASLHVAVLGTGIMGAAMARNLVRAGHRVTAWNRTEAKAAPLAEAGATVVTSPGDAVADADVVVTMLFDGHAVAAVMSGIAGRLRPGAAWIQSTTMGVDQVPALAALAAEAQVLFYDAPVLGTRAPAEAGQLTVLAAGPLEGRPLVDPVFAAIGARTVWTSDDGASAASTRLKLVANSWVLAVSNAAGETVALAEALGVNPSRFLDLIEGGPLDNGYLRAKSALIREDALAPASFGASTAGKDAALIVAAARAAGVRLDGAEAFAARLARAVEAGRGEQDMAAAYYASFDART